MRFTRLFLPALLLAGLTACASAPDPVMATFFNTSTDPEGNALFVYSMEFIPTAAPRAQQTIQQAMKKRRGKSDRQRSSSPDIYRQSDIPEEGEQADRQIQLEDQAFEQLEQRLNNESYCVNGYNTRKVYHGRKYVSIEGQCTSSSTSDDRS